MLLLGAFAASQLAAVPHAHDWTLVEQRAVCPTSRHVHCAWFHAAEHDHAHGRHTHGESMGGEPRPPVQNDSGDVVIVPDSLFGPVTTKVTSHANERPLYDCLVDTIAWNAVGRAEVEAAWHPPNERGFAGNSSPLPRHLRI